MSECKLPIYSITVNVCVCIFFWFRIGYFLVSLRSAARGTLYELNSIVFSLQVFKVESKCEGTLREAYYNHNAFCGHTCSIEWLAISKFYLETISWSGTRP